MKNIKSLLFLAFALMLAWPLQAQEEYPWFDAGENKKILQSATNLNKVQIGLPDTNKDVCYEWKGPNILDEEGNFHTEAYTPQIWVMPDPDSAFTTYKVVRFSSCGGEQSEVKVYVIDSIAITRVDALVECYNSGDIPELKDFRIWTDPANCHTLTEISPKKVYSIHQYGPGMTHGQDSMTFKLTFNNKTCIYPTSTHGMPVVVDVYNDNLTPKTQYSFNDVLHIPGLTKTDNTAVKALCDFLEAIEDNSVGLFDHLSPKDEQGHDMGWQPGQQAKWQFSLNLGYGNITMYETCCKNISATAKAYTIGSLTWSAEFAGWLGIPYLYYPGIGGFYGLAGVRGGVDFAPITITKVQQHAYNGDNCDGVQWGSIGLHFGGKVGLGAAVVDPAILSFEATIEPQVDVGIELGDLMKIPPVVVTLSANFAVNAIGFNWWNSTWRLYSFDLSTGAIYLWDKLGGDN